MKAGITVLSGVSEKHGLLSFRRHIFDFNRAGSIIVRKMNGSHLAPLRKQAAVFQLQWLEGGSLIVVTYRKTTLVSALRRELIRESFKRNLLSDCIIASPCLLLTIQFYRRALIFFDILFNSDGRCFLLLTAWSFKVLHMFLFASLKDTLRLHSKWVAFGKNTSKWCFKALSTENSLILWCLIL